MDLGNTKNGYVYFAQEPMWVMEHKKILETQKVVETHTYTRMRKQGKVSTYGWIMLEQPIGLIEAFFNSLVPAFREEF